MTTPWPAWISWLMLLAILATFIIVWNLLQSLGRVQNQLAHVTGGGGGRPRTKAELEELYVAGKVDRDTYDRMRGRLK